MTKSYFIIVSIFLSLIFTNAATIYVDVDAAGAGDGSSWADAFTDLQPAIDSASAGDQVWVAEGTYYPTSWPNGGSAERDKHFSLKDSVSAYGGFDGSETALDDRDVAAHETILSGDIDKDGQLDSDNCYHVFLLEGGVLNGTEVLDGFTVTQGYAGESDPNNKGGGMHNITDVTVANCTFTENFAEEGGGIYNIGRMTFSRCMISNNNASSSGGGIYNEGYTLAMDNCAVLGNNALDGFGGGIYNDGSGGRTQTIDKCTFNGNTVANTIFPPLDYSGAGIANFDVSSQAISNCIFWDNRWDLCDDDHIYCDASCSSYPTVSYCVVSNLNYVTDGGNNISDDPLLENDGYHLTAPSPCIDAGDPSAAGGTDIDGETRLFDGDGDSTAIIDMGADEYVDTSGSVPVELTSCTAVSVAGGVLLQWATASESGNLGFNVLRSASADGPFAQVNGALIPGAGTTALPQSYSFTDADVASGTWFYVLEQVDTGGAVSLGGVIPVDATSGIGLPVRNGVSGLRPVMLYDVSGAPLPAGTDAAGICIKVTGGAAVKVLRTE